ncbi:MAG TPA: IPTL-CTERM sorting domain-containing protein, partial [Usitatibacter sp.]|nr:IPTL-CTERM sorting domain-containing protein [Usitatibacter sp.]
RLYVANNTSGTVSIFDVSTQALIATVPVGASPYAYGAFIGGMALAPQAHQTPTLNEWALWILAMAVAGGGLLSMRSKRQ